ncbi:MAG: four helix bundle protein [Gemmatimonadales bacterium]
MRNHRSLEAWKEGRVVARLALELCRDHWKPSAAALFSQLQRSAISIPLNIAEGYALGDHGRFANHLAIAYGSASETSEILELGTEIGALESSIAAGALEHCRRCERLLLGLLKKHRPIPTR